MQKHYFNTGIAGEESIAPEHHNIENRQAAKDILDSHFVQVGRFWIDSNNERVAEEFADKIVIHESIADLFGGALESNRRPLYGL